MRLLKLSVSPIFIIAFIFSIQTIANAQAFNQDFKQALHWRNIGPFRGSRTRAVAGVPAQPNVFYMAQCNG
ncbi:MAG: hypothetical protein H0X49_17425, partial [Acidobacteria bacterium]|nr:hypothetical protein [Acidobacteriota bacterium]